MPKGAKLKLRHAKKNLAKVEASMSDEVRLVLQPIGCQNFVDHALILAWHTLALNQAAPKSRMLADDVTHEQGRSCP